MNIPVLMYHGLADASHPSGSATAAEELYVLAASTFVEQLQILRDDGYTAILFADLLAGQPLPEKPVILTFDDGHVSNYTLALPLLQQFAMRAEFFITTSWIGQEYCMDSEQIRQLAAAGMRIGSHGHSHRFFDMMTIEQLREELQTSQHQLQEITGGPVFSISAPGGRMHPALPPLATELGYSIVATSQFGYLSDPVQWQYCPRLVIKKTTTAGAFAHMLAAQKGYVLKKQMLQGMGALAKALLGNQRYVQMHRFIARFRQ